MTYVLWKIRTYVLEESVWSDTGNFFFLAKGYIVNIWGFEGYVVTVISTANCQPQTIYKQMGIAVFQ